MEALKILGVGRLLGVESRPREPTNAAGPFGPLPYTTGNAYTKGKTS
jgi:hypothetical protein